MKYYSEDEARRLVIKAGHRLLETGLIARTWGNISARISEDEFIITPSGMAYDTLLAEELVKVHIADLSYEGEIKPSSEKAVHAAAYALRPEAGFVIHTHQFFASVIGVEGKDTPFAAAAEYASPGTEELKENLKKVITRNPEKKAFYMEKHGALCLGENYDDAFDVAEKLESECRKIFENTVGNISGNDYFCAYAKEHKVLLPYIDDFAMILGTAVELGIDIGEICCGEDADAQRMILEKNCAAALYAEAVYAHPLDPEEANRQRKEYLDSYSKLMKRKQND